MCKLINPVREDDWELLGYLMLECGECLGGNLYYGYKYYETSEQQIQLYLNMDLIGHKHGRDIAKLLETKWMVLLSKNSQKRTFSQYYGIITKWKI